MARNDRAQWARLDIDGVALLADLAAGVSLARPLNFEETQPQWFGAPPAQSAPLHIGHFTGRVAQGASCNASVLSLVPHAHTTHTECVAHLTTEALAAWRVIPQRLLVTVLLTVQPEPAGADERGPVAQVTDTLITCAALRAAWPPSPAARLTARAAVVRTLPNGADKFRACPPGTVPPFLSGPAARELVGRGVAHLVLDVPSADRLEDGGAMLAHRIFFGLPPGSCQLGQAAHADHTITELAYVDDSLPDGWYLLSLQAPCIDGDAVTSRPVLYPLRTA